jgi:hypothetical protein
MHRRHFQLTPLYVAAMAAAAEPTKPEAVDNTTFDGKNVKVFASQGKRMAFLTKLEGFDPKLMSGLCDTFDKAPHFNPTRFPAPMKAILKVLLFISAAAALPAEEAKFYRAVNLGGPALRIDDRP